MPRLRESQHFRAQVLAPTWVSPWRLGAVGLALTGLVLGGLSLGGTLPEGFSWGFCLGTFGLGLASLFRGDARWREAEITASEGVLQIEGGGPGVGKLRARSVRALSTASTREGVVVALGMVTPERWPRRPVMIKVDELRDADAICDALAVGNRGLGVLKWPLRERRLRRQQMLVAAGVVACSVLMPAVHAVDRGMTVLFGMALAALTVMLGAMASQANFKEITLNSAGVDLSNAGCGWGLVPYHCIESVEAKEDEIEFKLTPPHATIRVPFKGPGELTVDELEHLLDQIRSASLRARGQGRRVRVADDALEDLKRGQETTTAWLQRLDAQASALRSGAYRGEGYNVSELWQALDDHDAAPEVRVAAARVLLRVQPDEAAARVAALADEQRDGKARKALELALEEEQDLEELGRRFDRTGLWGDPGAKRGA